MPAGHGRYRSHQWHRCHTLHLPASPTPRALPPHTRCTHAFFCQRHPIRVSRAAQPRQASAPEPPPSSCTTAAARLIQPSSSLGAAPQTHCRAGSRWPPATRPRSRPRHHHSSWGLGITYLMAATTALPGAHTHKNTNTRPSCAPPCGARRANPHSGCGPAAQVPAPRPMERAQRTLKTTTQHHAKQAGKQKQGRWQKARSAPLVSRATLQLSSDDAHTDTHTLSHTWPARPRSSRVHPRALAAPMAQHGRGMRPASCGALAGVHLPIQNHCNPPTYLRPYGGAHFRKACCCCAARTAGGHCLNQHTPHIQNASMKHTDLKAGKAPACDATKRAVARAAGTKAGGTSGDTTTYMHDCACVRPGTNSYMAGCPGLCGCGYG